MPKSLVRYCMSIKFKVLLLAIIGPTLLAITIFTYAVESIWTSEEAAVVHSAKGIVSMSQPTTSSSVRRSLTSNCAELSSSGSGS